MKRTTLFLSLILSASGLFQIGGHRKLYSGSGTFTVVQNPAPTNCTTSATTCAATLTQTTTTGTLLVFLITSGGTSGTSAIPISIAGANSNTNPITEFPSCSSGFYSHVIYVLPTQNTAAMTSPITVTYSASTASWVKMYEYSVSAFPSNVQPDNCDSIEPSAGTATTSTGPAFTLSGTNDVVMQMIANQGSTVSTAISPAAYTPCDACALNRSFAHAINPGGGAATWTWTTAVLPYPVATAFGFSSAAGSDQGFNDFEQGTNNGALTNANLASSQHGWHGGFWDVTGLVNSTQYTVSSVAAASGGNTTYTGTFTGGANGAFNGKIINFGALAAGVSGVSGNNSCTNAANNGTYTIQTSTGTTLVVNNPNGVAETTNSNFPCTAFGALPVTSVANASGGNTVYTGTFSNAGSNAYVGRSVTMQGFAQAANNGTFTVQASTTTTLTVNNASGVTDTVGVVLANLLNYSTVANASIPLKHSTGRLYGDGATYASGQGSVGMQLDTDGWPTFNTNTLKYKFLNTSGGNPSVDRAAITTMIKYNDDFPATSAFTLDCFGIHGGTDFAGGNCYGSTTTRFFQQETPSGNGQCTSGTQTCSQASLTITSVAAASGGTTVYTGTITSGGSNGYKGYSLTAAGFCGGAPPDTCANDGTFFVTASTATTITLTNPNGFVDTTGTISGNNRTLPVVISSVCPCTLVQHYNTGENAVVSYSITNNVVTFNTSAHHFFTPGELITPNAFGTSTFLNWITLTVLSTGLTGTSFQASSAGFSNPNVGTTTESGTVQGAHEFEIYDKNDAVAGFFIHANNATLDYPLFLDIGQNQTSSVQPAGSHAWFDSFQVSLTATEPNR